MSDIAEKPVARHSETSSPDPHGKHLIASAFADCERCTRHANRWSRMREYVREPAAEFLGTMILVIFGCGGSCQVVLSSSTAVSSTPKGDSLSLNLGWAIGLAMGVWVSAGISGGHVNPAVTLAFASVRGFPWKKVPGYILAQLLGALCGAGIIYANYYHAINLYEGGPDIRTISGTAGLFGTYAANYVTPVSCFFAEFLGSAMLIIAIFCATDKRNASPSLGLVPLVLFIALLGIGLGLGLETGAAVNPARDLGPRIMTAMVGYGRAVFDFRNQYWIWCPLLGPIFGMQAGALVYDALVYTGPDSIVNKPDMEAERMHLDGCVYKNGAV